MRNRNAGHKHWGEKDPSEWDDTDLWPGDTIQSPTYPALLWRMGDDGVIRCVNPTAITAASAAA